MKFTINHKSPVPLHIQAEEVLRQMIQEPEYKGGKILPNEVEMSKHLAISRTTLRQAINKLVFEGLLVRKKKTGTRVAQMPVSSKSNNWLSFSQEMKLRCKREYHSWTCAFSMSLSCLSCWRPSAR